MELTFSRQASADLYRNLLGEFVIYDNQAKKKLLSQHLQDRQVLSAFEEHELNVNLSPCLASDHCARLGTRAGMFQADSRFRCAAAYWRHACDNKLRPAFDLSATCAGDANCTTRCPKGELMFEFTLTCRHYDPTSAFIFHRTMNAFDTGN